jgi:hypothetical protein
VIIISSIIVLATGVASVFFAHPRGALGTPGHLEPADPVAVAINATTSITKPVRLTPPDRGGNAMGPILLIDDESRDLMQSAVRERSNGIGPVSSATIGSEAVNDGAEAAAEAASAPAPAGPSSPSARD